MIRPVRGVFSNRSGANLEPAHDKEEHLKTWSGGMSGGDDFTTTTSHIVFCLDEKRPNLVAPRLNALDTMSRHPSPFL